MRVPGWWLSAGAAALLAVTAPGCQRGEDRRSPVEIAQQRSSKALKAAEEAQRKAMEEQQQAERAQQEVQEAQRALQQAHAKAAKERQEAQQAQLQAQNQTRQAQQQAMQAQQQAIEAQQAQAQQWQQPDRGGSVERELTASGHLVQASPDQLVIETPEQPELRLRIDDRTTLLLDGNPASASDLPEGAQVRASYQPPAEGQAEPTALRVEATSQPGP